MNKAFLYKLMGSLLLVLGGAIVAADLSILTFIIGMMSMLLGSGCIDKYAVNYKNYNND